MYRTSTHTHAARAPLRTDTATFDTHALPVPPRSGRGVAVRNARFSLSLSLHSCYRTPFPPRAHLRARFDGVAVSAADDDDAPGVPCARINGPRHGLFVAELSMCARRVTSGER